MTLSEAIILDARQKLQERYPKFKITYRKDINGYRYAAKGKYGFIFGRYDQDQQDALAKLEMTLDAIRMVEE